MSNQPSPQVLKSSPEHAPLAQKVIELIQANASEAAIGAELGAAFRFKDNAATRNNASKIYEFLLNFELACTETTPAIDKEKKSLLYPALFAYLKQRFDATQQERIFTAIIYDANTDLGEKQYNARGQNIGHKKYDDKGSELVQQVKTAITPPYHHALLTNHYLKSFAGISAISKEYNEAINDSGYIDYIESFRLIDNLKMPEIDISAPLESIGKAMQMMNGPPEKILSYQSSHPPKLEKLIALLRAAYKADPEAFTHKLLPAFFKDASTHLERLYVDPNNPQAWNVQHLQSFIDKLSTDVKQELPESEESAKELTDVFIKQSARRLTKELTSKVNASGLPIHRQLHLCSELAMALLQGNDYTMIKNRLNAIFKKDKIDPNEAYLLLLSMEYYFTSLAEPDKSLQRNTLYTAFFINLDESLSAEDRKKFLSILNKRAREESEDTRLKFYQGPARVALIATRNAIASTERSYKEVEKSFGVTSVAAYSIAVLLLSAALLTVSLVTGVIPFAQFGWLFIVAGSGAGLSLVYEWFYEKTFKEEALYKKGMVMPTKSRSAEAFTQSRNPLSRPSFPLIASIITLAVYVILQWVPLGLNPGILLSSTFNTFGASIPKIPNIPGLAFAIPGAEGVLGLFLEALDVIFRQLLLNTLLIDVIFNTLFINLILNTLSSAILPLLFVITLWIGSKSFEKLANTVDNPSAKRFLLNIGDVISSVRSISLPLMFISGAGMGTDHDVLLNIAKMLLVDTPVALINWVSVQAVGGPLITASLAMSATLGAYISGGLWLTVGTGLFLFATYQRVVNKKEEAAIFGKAVNLKNLQMYSGLFLTTAAIMVVCTALSLTNPFTATLGLMALSGLVYGVLKKGLALELSHGKRQETAENNKTFAKLPSSIITGPRPSYSQKPQATTPKSGAQREISMSHVSHNKTPHGKPGTGKK